MVKVEGVYCRACMTINMMKDMIHFQNSENNLDELFCKYTYLNVSAGDMLSQFICKNCSIKIVEWHALKFESKKTSGLNFCLDKSIANESCSLHGDELNDFIVLNDNESCNSSMTIDSKLNGSLFHNAKKELITNKYIKGRKACFLCNICNKKFFKERRLEGHIRQHQGLKPAICQICNKEFNKWGALDAHVEYKHTSNKKEKFPCNYPGCNKSYFMKQSLVRHKNKTHTENKRGVDSFLCDVCGKSMASNGALKKHKYIHSGQMPFQCEICFKKFPTNHKLKEHMHRHAGVKNFECLYCGLKKVTAYELKKHINIHTKEKSFPCKLCSANFSNIGNADRHYNTIHCGIKSFLCTYCDKSFGKAETLKHHIMTHTGEKPHSCKTCGKRFIQLIALKTHEKAHLKYNIKNNVV